MSLIPKKKHGPELKCGGPGLCSDCTPMSPLGLPGPLGVSLTPYDIISGLKDLGINVVKLDDYNYKLPCCYNCGHKEFLYHELLDFFSCSQCQTQGNGNTLLENKNLIKSAEFWDFVTYGPQK